MPAVELNPIALALNRSLRLRWDAPGGEVCWLACQQNGVGVLASALSIVVVITCDHASCEEADWLPAKGFQVKRSGSARVSSILVCGEWK
jgi:hypothetical protein